MMSTSVAGIRHVPEGLENGLRNYWYPVLRSDQLRADHPLGFKVLNENLVAWRDARGHPNVARDKCPHRGVKLSIGRVLAGDLQCAWHGVRFDGRGACTLIPWEPGDSRLKSEIALGTYPTRELDEDRVMIESLGELAQSRAEEYLFGADQDVVSVRRMMAEAWEAQQAGRRPLADKSAFAFPF